MSNEAFVSIKGLNKTFVSKGESIHVLKDIDIEIKKGEIFGVVGLSGAGKSTFVRCINRLEEPDNGEIIIGDVDITKLNEENLNKKRQKIGMIFQQFNLFYSMDVYENIELPLTLSNLSKSEIDERVKELVSLVNLDKQIHYYPAQLSGGQLQRVGIARALATGPELLLSDEATSALDPPITLQILDLLKKINKDLNLTIIFISHEVDSVRYLCDRIGIIENGEIVEILENSEDFDHPTSKTGKTFLEVVNKLYNFGEK